MKLMNLCLLNRLCTSLEILHFLHLSVCFRYKQIIKQTPVLKKWVDKLISEGVIKREWYDVCLSKLNLLFKRELRSIF